LTLSSAFNQMAISSWNPNTNRTYAVERKIMYDGKANF